MAVASLTLLGKEIALIGGYFDSASSDPPIAAPGEFSGTSINVGQEPSGSPPARFKAGGIPFFGTRLRLYESMALTSPTAISTFVESSGPGYPGPVSLAMGTGTGTTGDQFTGGDWQLKFGAADGSTTKDRKKLLIAQKSWLATGDTFDVLGAYLTNAVGDLVIAWWSRTSPVTIAAGDTFTADNLEIALTIP